MDLHSTTLLVALKLLLAMLCGGAIGLERELSRKAAGLRTNVLICMGAALFMVISRHISGGAPYTDPARLVAQVVAGIGFLGAGVILRSRGSISGLTTAATIFLVGALGIAIGEGLYTIAVMTTALVLCVLVLLRKLEGLVLRKRRLFHYSFRTNEPSKAFASLLRLLEEEGARLENYNMTDKGAGHGDVSFTVVASVEVNARLIERLNEIGRLVDTSTED